MQESTCQEVGAFIFGEFERRKTMEYQGRWYRKVTLRGNDYMYANFGTRNFRVCFPDKLLIAVESKTLADFQFYIVPIIELLRYLVRKRTDVIDCGDDKIATLMVIANIGMDLHQFMRKLENL